MDTLERFAGIVWPRSLVDFVQRARDDLSLPLAQHGPEWRQYVRRMRLVPACARPSSEEVADPL